MDVIVSKFGGSSAADAGMLRRVGNILRSDPARRCAVLSAPGGEHRVTDLLAECVRLRRLGRPADGPLGAVADRFAGIAGGLGLPDPRAEVLRELEAALAASPDMALSRGEALCARLFARWMHWPFLDAGTAVRFDADGALDVPASLAALSAAGRELHRFVLPGFYGQDACGLVRTLPRNGSDITGALAAAALRADVYENWTDVPGLMTADPSMVPGARPIPRIGYRQMAAMARAGAKVLHPDCLGPVARAGIPTRLCCTMDPGAPGTLIDGAFSGIVPCVVGSPAPGADGRAAVTVFGATAAMKPRLVRALHGALVAEDEAVHAFSTDPDRLAEDVRAAHHILCD